MNKLSNFGIDLSLLKYTLTLQQYGVENLVRKGEYKVFCYEDTCCSNLTKQIQSMLDFVRLPVYREFMEYIREINSVKNVPEAELRIPCGNIKRLIRDQLVTWRGKLKPPPVSSGGRNRLQRCHEYIWIQTGKERYQYGQGYMYSVTFREIRALSQ